MAAQKRLCVGSRGGDGGLELSDDTSATDDRVSLTAMLDAIEQVGETSRRASVAVTSITTSEYLMI